MLSGEGYPHGATDDDHLINFWGAKESLVEGITFRNITANGAVSQPSEIFGWDADHTVSDVSFQDLKINGNLIPSAEEGDFEIDAETTADITFIHDTFLTGEDCEAQLGEARGDADSVEVYGEQLHLVNTLPDPEAECFTTAGWQTAEPVTPPFTVGYTIDVAGSDFGYGGYVRASLI